jgi:hypothetical protein
MLYGDRFICVPRAEGSLSNGITAQRAMIVVSIVRY